MCSENSIACFSLQIKETDMAKLICGNCEGQVFADLMRYENVQDVQRKIANFSKMLSQVCVDLFSFFLIIHTKYSIPHQNKEKP